MKSYSNNVIQFRPRNLREETPSLFLEFQQAAVDVLCVGSAVLLVSTAAIGVGCFLFFIGTLVTFE